MDSWIGEAVGKMHMHNISQTELAETIGVRRDYLNKILNGKYSPTGVRERVEKALSSIIARKGDENRR